MSCRTCRTDIELNTESKNTGCRLLSTLPLQGSTSPRGAGTLCGVYIPALTQAVALKIGTEWLPWCSLGWHLSGEKLAVSGASEPAGHSRIPQHLQEGSALQGQLTAASRTLTG